MTATSKQLFKPTQARAEKLAAQTNSTARRIVKQEAASRDEKTERLRALRLAKTVANP